jgi:hypothetical protein
VNHGNTKPKIRREILKGIRVHYLIYGRKAHIYLNIRMRTEDISNIALRAHFAANFFNVHFQIEFK